jgi:hypothetical protein
MDAAQAAIAQHDEDQGGFVRVQQLPTLLSTMRARTGLPLAGAEQLALESRLRTRSDGMEVVFADLIVAELGPLLRQLADQPHAGAGGAAGDGGKPAAKRARTDSEMARELQAEDAGTGGVGSGSSGTGSVRHTLPASPMPSAAAGAAGTGAGASADGFLKIKFDLSSFGSGGGSSAGRTPARANHHDGPPMLEVTTHSASSSSSSSSMVPAAEAAALRRDLELFHYNGLSSLVGARPRQPRLTRLLLQQRDAGGVGGAGTDALAMDEAQQGLGLGGIEEQTRLAMQLSLMAAGGGGGGGSGSDSGAVTNAAAAAAAAAADGAPPPGSAASARASAAIEGLLRTKWPGAHVVFVDGSPPSLD